MVATLYLGQPGSGKTHALHAHPNGHLRHIYVDAGQPHRQVCSTSSNAPGVMVKNLIRRSGVSDSKYSPAPAKRTRDANLPVPAVTQLSP